ncbi:MAG: hypothetical protein L3J14_01360 [Flavobacteriaceae bacterium]|nr:hypothetical protein [Flavobacteriaceae bacterium]
MKKSLKKLFLIVVFTSITFVSYAQGPGGGPGPCTSPPCNPPNPPGLPIDGGAIFLLSSGLIYAINKLRRKEE